MCSRRCLKSEIWYELTNIFFVHLTAASGVSPCRLLVAASDIGVAIFGSRFTAWLGNHVQPHMGARLLTGGDAKKEMDFRGITFCRCGIADKTFPGETAKRRFSGGPVGWSRSQSSWCVLTATDGTELHLKYHRFSLPATVFFLPVSNLWWKVMVRGSSMLCWPTLPRPALALARTSGVRPIWRTCFNQTGRMACADGVRYLSTSHSAAAATHSPSPPL